MRFRALHWAALVLCASCRESTPVPVVAPSPASLVATATPTATVTVGTSAGAVGVQVLDDSGDPFPGAVVTFAISRGGGTLGAISMRSAADGIASTTYRSGTAAGLNEISVFVAGLAPLKFMVTGTAGLARTIILNQRSLKYTTAIDSLLASATPRDSFLNATGTPITWVARDPTLVGFSGAGGNAIMARVLRRPGSTFLVATSGTATDSVTVIVQDSLSTPCTFQSTPVTLAVGGTLQFDGGTTCIRSLDSGAEYAVVAHLNTAVYGISQSFDVSGDGIASSIGVFPGPPAAQANAEAPVRTVSPGAMLRVRDLAFERRMRDQEAREIGAWVAPARAAMRARAARGATSNILPAAPREGDLVKLNVNAQDFCAQPDVRQGRIAAISKTAIIVADLANPPGGFSDAEYRAFGDAMDTLVTPIDTGAFGAPTDLDGNGRVAVFFTQAVNQLTFPGSPGGIVLGYYYLRDLLPRASPFGDCPGSNVGEMFYVLVPDSLGDVNGNVRSKAFVASTIASTVAHEYQHLINASRRMYVNDAFRVDEEPWLNEGLSHIAEELVFYRAAGLLPRANIGAALLAAGTVARNAFDSYQTSNVARYQQFLRFPESTSPMSNDDLLTTRGAAWSYLRYVVDRVRSNDGDFWRRLVNSRWSGVVNLDSALAGSGVTATAALRDWSTAVLADDYTSVGAAHRQPSWNFVSMLGAGIGGAPYALNPRILLQGTTSAVGVVGGGTSYLRFGVSQNREALIRVTAQGGGAVPNGMRLTVVRIK